MVIKPPLVFLGARHGWRAEEGGKDADVIEKTTKAQSGQKVIKLPLVFREARQDAARKEEARTPTFTQKEPTKPSIFRKKNLE